MQQTDLSRINICTLCNFCMSMQKCIQTENPVCLEPGVKEEEGSVSRCERFVSVYAIFCFKSPLTRKIYQLLFNK